MLMCNNCDWRGRSYEVVMPFSGSDGECPWCGSCNLEECEHENTVVDDSTFPRRARCEDCGYIYEVEIE